MLNEEQFRQTRPSVTLGTEPGSVAERPSGQAHLPMNNNSASRRTLRRRVFTKSSSLWCGLLVAGVMAKSSFGQLPPETACYDFNDGQVPPATALFGATALATGAEGGDVLHLIDAAPAIFASGRANRPR